MTLIIKPILENMHIYLSHKKNTFQLESWEQTWLSEFEVSGTRMNFSPFRGSKSSAHFEVPCHFPCTVTSPSHFSLSCLKSCMCKYPLETCWNQIISKYACHCETLCLLAYLSENSVTITTINLTPQNEYARDCRETSLKKFENNHCLSSTQHRSRTTRMSMVITLRMSLTKYQTSTISINGSENFLLLPTEFISS
jgi:hypothetical protein